MQKIFYRQKERSRFTIYTEVKKEKFERSDNISYENEEATLDIEIISDIQLTDEYPITIASFIVGVPKYLPLSIPTYILRFWPFVEELPLDTIDKRLPMKLKPNDLVEDIKIRGLTVFKALDEQGYSGDITLMIGFYDNYENAYYGPALKVETSELEKDCGNGIWVEWPLSLMWL